MYWILETNTIKLREEGCRGQDRTLEASSSSVAPTREAAGQRHSHLRSICMIHVTCVNWHFHVYEKDM